MLYPKHAIWQRLRDNPLKPGVPVPGVWRHSLQGRPIDLSVVVLFHLQEIATAPHQRICSAWEFVNRMKIYHGEAMVEVEIPVFKILIFSFSRDHFPHESLLGLER